MFCCWDCNYYKLSCVDEQICCNTSCGHGVQANNVTVKSEKQSLEIYETPVASGCSGCGVL